MKNYNFILNKLYFGSFFKLKCISIIVRNSIDSFRPRYMSRRLLLVAGSFYKFKKQFLIGYGIGKDKQISQRVLAQYTVLSLVYYILEWQ